MQLSNKQINILKSTGILFSISFLISGGFFFSGVGHFFDVFLIITGFQFILFTFFGTLIKNHLNKNLRERELEKLESLSTILECAYCKKKNLVVFDPNDTERFEFKCEHCDGKNLVTLQFAVSQVFEPMEIPKTITIPTEKM